MTLFGLCCFLNIIFVNGREAEVMRCFVAYTLFRIPGFNITPKVLDVKKAYLHDATSRFPFWRMKTSANASISHCISAYESKQAKFKM